MTEKHFGKAFGRLGMIRSILDHSHRGLLLIHTTEGAYFVLKTGHILEAHTNRIVAFFSQAHNRVSYL